ncbi:hypothetical protein Tco_0886671 [Tanacetum coccineum]
MNTTERLIDDLESAYGNDLKPYNAPNMFSIRIHHGGSFRRYPCRKYVDSHVYIFDMVDIDLFSVIALNMMVLQLGYTGEFEPMFYNYLRPLSTLDEGLYALACKEDVRCLATLVRSFKLLEVYIEHGVTAINSYQRPPPQVFASRSPVKDSVCEFVTPRCMPHGMLIPPTNDFVITYTQLSGVQRVDTQDHVIPTIQSQFSDINMSFVSQQLTASHVIEDVMSQLSFEETELDGEAGFGDVVSSGIDSFGLSHDESFGVDNLDLNLNVTVDLNVSQTETQAELHVSEVPVSEDADVIVEDHVSSEEDVEQGNGQEAMEASSDGQFFYDVKGINSAYEIENHVASSKDAGTDDDDNEDDDFLVDEENEIVEPDVDVHLFGISMDVLFDNIGATNLVPDDVLKGVDVDVVNPDGFDNDTGNYTETSNYRMRRLNELRREMEGVMNASGQWKYLFYIG